MRWSQTSSPCLIIRSNHSGRLGIFCQLIIALEACRFGWIIYIVQLDMMPPCSIHELFFSLLLSISWTNEPCIWQYSLLDCPFGLFVSDLCMCIFCVCGSHQQDGDKAGRKILLLGTISIAKLKYLNRNLLREARYLKGCAQSLQ